MRTTTDRGTTYERFRAVILARVARGQAFYATPVDRGVAAAARATGGYARSYYRDLATRLAQSGPQVRQRIRSWFTPAEDGSLSRRQKVAIAALNVLSIPGFAVYATLEVTAAAVMTAAVGPLTLAIGLVRIVGWVLMTAAWLAAAAVALTLMLASWLLGLLVLAVMAVTAVVFLAVAFVSFLLDRAARLIAPFGLPSFQGKVTEHLLADEPTQQQPEAPRRMRPVVPQSA